jgi:hypothetical protein
MTNDEELDRLEQELRDYLRTPRDSWKREPKMRRLLELNEQYKEEIKREALTERPWENPQ